MKDENEQKLTATMGTTLFKIYLYFHNLLTASSLSLEEHTRLEDTFAHIQNVFIETLSPKIQSTASMWIGEYMKENLSSDPQEVGANLLQSLVKYRLRGVTRTSNFGDQRKSCLPQLDDEIANRIDVTNDLYQSSGTL